MKHREKSAQPATAPPLTEKQRKLDRQLDEALEEIFLAPIRWPSASRRRMIGCGAKNNPRISTHLSLDRGIPAPFAGNCVTIFFDASAIGKA